mgnify:CR=1 FL=1
MKKVYDLGGYVAVFGKFPEGIVEVRGVYQSYDDARVFTEDERSDKADETAQLDYMIMPVGMMCFDDEDLDDQEIEE